MYVRCFQVWSVDAFVGSASSNQSEAAVHRHQQTATAATLPTGDTQTCSTWHVLMLIHFYLYL